MSTTWLPVPVAIQDGPDGVFPGRDVRDVDDWVQRYLEDGLCWHDWRAQRAFSQTALDWEVSSLVDAYGMAGAPRPARGWEEEG